MVLLTFPIVIPKETLRSANSFTSIFPTKRPSVVKRWRLSQYALRDFLVEYGFEVQPFSNKFEVDWLPTVTVNHKGTMLNIFCHNIKHTEKFWKIYTKDDWQENDYIALTTINNYVIEIFAVMQWGHLRDQPKFLDREFINTLTPERLFDIVRFSPLVKV